MVTVGAGVFRPTIAHVRDWADERGIPDESLAELDLRLTHVIGLIATSDVGEALCFKGGTVLNKLYFSDDARLSVDLDFNAVGEEREAYQQYRAAREALIALLQQAGMDVQHHDYGITDDHILFRYRAVSTGDLRVFQVEISLIERFAVCGFVRQPLMVPSTSLPSKRIEVSVKTAKLVELIATKLRALHQRRKSRDIFDVWQASYRIEDTAVLRKLVLFYFASRNVIFDRRGFFETLDQKLRDRRFREHLTVFLRPDSAFDWETGTREVRRWLDGVFALDEDDEEFIRLTKHLVGVATGRKAVVVARHVTHPLVFLLGNRSDLSDEARRFTAEDLRRLMLGTKVESDPGV